jgi:prepilin-type N-terminal cleavage/methylation domain-containing protein
MRIERQIRSGTRLGHRAGLGGFTLPEMMVTLAIFSLVVAGVVSTHLFGLRMIGLTEPKMLADAEARRFLNEFVRDVREANAATIIDGTTRVSEGSVLRLEYWRYGGGGVTTNYTTYELDTTYAELIRYDTEEGVDQPARLVAEGIANTAIFRREIPDIRGDLASNEIQRAEPGAHRAVIAVHLIYSLLPPTDYPLGPEQRFKEYELRAKVAFRAR